MTRRSPGRSRAALAALATVTVLVPLLVLDTAPQPAVGSSAAPAGTPALHLPLSFEANVGQADPEVDFYARGPGYGLFLTGTGASMALEGTQGDAASVLRLAPVGANPAAVARGVQELPGKANYLVGDDPSGWQRNVPTYGRVEFDDVYPGVDLAWYGNEGRPEYDFIVAPGADPSPICMDISGASDLRLEDDGSLVLATPAGEVRQHPPLVYQELDGRHRRVEAGYVLDGDEVSFSLGAYDTGSTLVIDPVLEYSTFLGGSAFDFAAGVAVDPQGNTYLSGSTRSNDFPTVSAIQPSSGGNADAFVAKISADGSTLLYSTYMGGGGPETSFKMDVDDTGSAHVAGVTSSPNFPVVNPVKGSFGGGVDMFASRLTPDGSALVYSTYLGGPGPDVNQGVALDPLGNFYLVGFTASPNFATSNVVQPALGGALDVGVAKLSPSGALTYATYLGGFGPDFGFGVVADAAGRATVTGFAGSRNFPTRNAIQPAFAGGMNDGFVARLSADGTSLDYSTFIGGTGDDDAGFALALDPGGNTYVAGRTSSPDFPTVAPFQATLAGMHDAYMAKLGPDGTSLVYATYLGGSGGEGVGLGIAVDGAGRAVATGRTGSNDFPTRDPIQAHIAGGPTDAFVSQLDASGSALAFSTYLGSGGQDGGNALTMDAAGTVYVAGFAGAGDFPTVDPLQGANAGDLDAFLAKIQLGGEGCGGLVPTIEGSDAAETITGTDGDDVIVGRGGNDLIVGGGGQDVICGGEGDDGLQGRAGDDRLFGGAGNDVVSGAAGEDVLDGAEGDDSLSSDAGFDVLVGGPGHDSVRGGTGNDRSFGGDGDDTVTDGAGDDQLFGGAGNDAVRGGIGGDNLVGDAGDDRLLGEAGDDTLLGGAGDNKLNGGDGTDACDGTAKTSCEADPPAPGGDL
jgi:Ca2+-binding RTX toxin-like protein